MTIATPCPVDIETIRQDFPLLGRPQQGRRLVYLDSAATSQKPQQVIDALVRYYTEQNANVHRGVYFLAEEATATYENARLAVSSFIHASPEETIFVRNATEGINLVASSWGRANLKDEDVILLTELEHHSNLVPWQMVAAQSGAQLKFIGLQEDGSLDLDTLDQHLSSGRVRMVACAYISNVLGTVAPVKVIAERAHAAGAMILVDAAQAVPHMHVDVRELDVDFLVFTGHKMLGPMGIGVLYGRREVLEAMPPFLGGGEMIRRVSLERSTWNDLPWKFEAGTPSVGDASGLAAAVAYLEGIGMEAIAAHDRELTAYAMDRLAEIDGLTIYGPQNRGAVVAFSLAEIHPHDLASLLDEEGIAVRAGHHCAQPLHEQLGLSATTRASFYLYNDRSDVDSLVTGIRHARETFRG